MDFALTYPSRVKALIMVDSGPTGLELDTPGPDDLFEQAEKAYHAGNLDLAAEIETRIWFDGMGRTPDQVNQKMRQLAYGMNRIALSHDAKGLGKRIPDIESPAVNHLGALHVPVLVVVGDRDIPYMLSAADYMVDKISTAQKVIIEDAAHMPNMDQPDAFQRVVTEFLDRVTF